MQKKSLISLSILIFAVSACSVKPSRPDRRGLLERDGTASVAGRGEHKTPSELYSIKPGGEVNLNGSWQWPLKNVEISSPYGERSGRFHQGIDLRAPMKTPVMAAADGEVVYVGTKIRGYGKMVVLKHSGNFYTVYAHHSKNVVKMGSKVDKGDVIAYSGRTGHSSGPHLHFELRRGTQSFDPEYAFNGYYKSPANRKIASQSHLNHDFEE